MIQKTAIRKGFFISLVSSLLVTLFALFLYADTYTHEVYIHPTTVSWDDARNSSVCLPLTSDQCLPILGSYSKCNQALEDSVLCTYSTQGNRICGMGEGNFYYTYVTWHNRASNYIEGGIANPEEVESLPFSFYFDTSSQMCIQCGNVWEPSASNNKCCGDDSSDDPDISNFSCHICPQGLNKDTPGLRHWETSISSNNCCGDDASDCGMTSGEWVCADTSLSGSTQRPWYWTKASDHTGDILDAQCSTPYSAFLSNGEAWIGCGAYNALPTTTKRFTLLSTLGTNEVPNPYPDLYHDYLCYSSSGNYAIAECCGNTYNNCDNNLGEADGTAAIAGGSAKLQDKTYFCTENMTFTTDLDNFPRACEGAYYISNSSLRDYLWTGTKCCSEPEDTNPVMGIYESYNDPNGTGACFKGAPIENGKNFSIKQIMSVNGVLSACAPINATLRAIRDTYTNEPLIHNVDYCQMSEYFYCDVSGEWKLAPGGKNVSNVVTVPLSWTDVTAKTGCCVPDSCWNGTLCVDNQAYKPRDPPKREKYRCSNGEWQWSIEKRGLDGFIGWCPRNDQCLVTVSSTAGEFCIDNGEYINDDYCDNGNWSSRTKFIGLSLLSIVDSNKDYILYCGPYTETLNYFTYTLSHSIFDYIYVKDLFEDEVANNICLLSYDNRTFIATSLNLGNFTFSELGYLLKEFEDCNPNSFTEFESCNRQNTDAAWVNARLSSVVYSSLPFTLPRTPNYGSLYSSLVESRLSSVTSTLKSTIQLSAFTYSFVNDSRKMKWFFSKREGVNSMIATLDRSDEADFFIAKYEGVDAKFICDQVSAYNYTMTSRTGSSNRANTEIACKAIDGQPYVIAYGSLSADIDPMTIWSDLTGKLRLN